MARTSNFANVATVTRASTKTDAGGWDFTNGGTVGTLTEYASGVAAIHPTAGLLVEESTTNEIRNPRCEGAVAGSPGTLPTNWLASGEGSLSREIVGSGSNAGSPYVDIKYSGTDTTNINIFPESVTQIVAAQGEAWTFSWGIQLIAGGLSNVSSVYLQFNERTAAGANLAADAQSSILASINSTHKRFYHTRTLTEATTARLSGALVLVVAGAVDFTLRLFAPQMEEKAYPTSPVLPVAASPAAATRAADVITVPNGAWEKSGSGFSCYIEMTTLGSSDGVSLALGPDNNNRLGIEGDGFVFLNSGASTLLNSAYGGDTSAGANIKVAARLADANYAVSRSTVAQLTASTGNATQYGGGTSTGRSPGGGALTVQGFYIRDIRYWPKALTNAELEALVGN